MCLVAEALVAAVVERADPAAGVVLALRKAEPRVSAGAADGVSAGLDDVADDAAVPVQKPP